MYIPKPISLSDVIIPEDLMSRLEQIAKNTHEVWAQSRIAQGWTYGEVRNDELKQHPGLIPCEELSDEEADYDRNISIQVIKTILSQGFSIVRNETM